jgi:RNA recognition motif-containing protein
LGYAYVNFERGEDAKIANQDLNFRKINGKPCRIMPQSRDPYRLSCKDANIVIKNLPRDKIDARGLYEWILKITDRRITSCKIGTDHKTGSPLGYAFAQFETEDDATKAICKINESQTPAGNGRAVLAERFNSEKSISTIYVRYIPVNWNKKDITSFFHQFGDIDAVRIPVQPPGTCFVRFQHARSVDRAISQLHDKILPGQSIPLVVEKALTGKERRRRHMRNEEKARSNSASRTFHSNTAQAQSQNPTPSLSQTQAQTPAQPSSTRDVFIAGLEEQITEKGRFTIPSKPGMPLQKSSHTHHIPPSKSKSACSLILGSLIRIVRYLQTLWERHIL